MVPRWAAEVVAFALYFTNFPPSWPARLYLEDLYVQPPTRKGVGEALW